MDKFQPEALPKAPLPKSKPATLAPSSFWNKGPIGPRPASLERPKTPVSGSGGLMNMGVLGTKSADLRRSAVMLLIVTTTMRIDHTKYSSSNKNNSNKM